MFIVLGKKAISCNARHWVAGSRQAAHVTITRRMPLSTATDKVGELVWFLVVAFRLLTYCKEDVCKQNVERERERTKR